MKEFIKINIASPKKILEWTERPLPNGELIGEVKKPLQLKNIPNRKTIIYRRYLMNKKFLIGKNNELV